MKKKEQITYFAYIRKSSERDEAQTLSIDAQKRELQAYCDRYGIKVKKFFIEAASAYKKGRKEFGKMLSAFEAGEAEGLLVYHLSRIARNSFDGGNVIYMMDEGKIKHILTPSGEFHAENGDDLLIMQIHFAMAKKSSDDTSTYVKRDIQSKLLKGEYPSYVSVGYLNLDQYGRIAGKGYDQHKQAMLHDIAEMENRKLRRVEPDPLLAPIVTQLFEIAATGNYTYTQLADEAFKMGLKGARSNKKLSKSSLQRLLTNPIHYGGLRYQNIILEAEELPEETRHKAIISKNLFDDVQVALGVKTKPRKVIHNHAYRGMLQCNECGSAITSELQKGVIYYRCTKKKNTDTYKCSQKFLREDQLETQMETALEEYAMPKDFAEWALGVLRKNSKQETGGRDVMLSQLRKKQTEADAKISNLLDLKLSSKNMNGEMLTDEEYIVRKKDLITEKEELNAKIQDLEASALDWLERCEEFFDFALNRKQKWLDGSDVDRKFIFVRVFGSNSLLRDQKLLSVAKRPFVTTASLRNRSDWRE